MFNILTNDYMACTPPTCKLFFRHFLFIAFMSPADLSIWFIWITALVLYSAPHISRISPSLFNLRWKRMLRRAYLKVTDGHWSKMLKSVITWNPVKFTRHLRMWQTSGAVQCMLFYEYCCGRLMAWALIITLMRRQDVHPDTSVKTMFAE